MRRLFGWLVIFGLGVWFGAWAFRDVQPRTWLSVSPQGVSVSDEELLGYLGSAATQHAPGLIPTVALQTDKTIAMKYPIPWKSRYHFVIVPKRDIRDVGALSKGDEAYLIDAFAVIGRLARENGMTRYKVITNGPREQAVRYLHFHLVSVEPKGTPSDPRDTLRTNADL
jgi:histidine triad (HIT) family protein